MTTFQVVFKRLRAARVMVCIALLAVCAAPQASAQDSAPALSADMVLQSSAAHFPAILESLARREAAQGAVVAADGAFDLVFSADGFDRLSGTWNGGVVNTQLSQNLRALGGRVYGGYRVSDGAFPIYEDINFTNTGGEAKIGALFSLLRDRAIDARRFNVADTRLALRQAELDVLLTKIGVQHKALLAYWRWVAAGRQLEIYEDLLRIAEEREAGLTEQVRRGARAAIFITENRQNITRRQRLATQARRDFLTAANALSFYYRGADGAPLIPQEEQLPALEDVDLVITPVTADQSVVAAMANRPELGILKTALERARVSVELSRNEMRPRFDLRAEVSRDFGAIAEGGSSRDSTDAIVGFRFSVPFQQREARGRLQSARAKLEAAKQERRRTEEQIELEIRNILINLTVSEELVRIAGQEVEQSETMQRAEQQRFASGASDFFLVNVREETAADARIRHLLAQLQIQMAQANFDAATVNLERLGIGG
ncbi:MAG: TolC family protein [Pseudomonadota bacterium]